MLGQPPRRGNVEMDCLFLRLYVTIRVTAKKPKLNNTEMKTLKSTLLLGALVGVSTLNVQTLLAQPSASITNLVNSPSNALWDFSKLTNDLQNVDFTIFKVSHGVTNTQAEVAYADPFTQDGHGKFSGSGSTAVTLTTEGTTTTNTLTYKVNGSVTTSKDAARINFTTKVSGAAEVNGKTRNVTASATYIVSVDAVTGEVTGRQATHASASGLGSIASSTSIDSPLTNFVAEIGDGTWTLVLGPFLMNNVVEPGKPQTLTGNATVTLSSGTVYPFNITGTFVPHTGESHLNLKGQDNGAGSMLVVTLNSSNQVNRITGHVSGQTVKLSQ